MLRPCGLWAEWMSVGLVQANEVMTNPNPAIPHSILVIPQLGTPQHSARCRLHAHTKLCCRCTEPKPPTTMGNAGGR